VVMKPKMTAQPIPATVRMMKINVIVKTAFIITELRK
jgi:hypothetical protein